MSPRPKTRIIIILAFAALALLALPKLPIWQDPKSDAGRMTSRDPRTSVDVLVVTPERLAETISTVGTILSNEEVEIRSEISGKIEKVLFAEGRGTHKGDTLVMVNDEELQARLLSARYRQELAQLNEERQRRLFEKNLASQQEYDATVNQLNIVRAEAQLLRAQLAKAAIRAPFAGELGLRFVSDGSYITPNTLITTLHDNHMVKIDFTVPEKYAGSLSRGTAITFRIQGNPEAFTAEVYAIAPRIEEATRTARVRALARNPQGMLLPGKFVNVELKLKERRTLTVPAYAVVPELKLHKVFLYRMGKAEERVVEIGMRTDQRVEVTSGIAPGDTVITSALLQLRTGIPVQLGEGKIQ